MIRGNDRFVLPILAGPLLALSALTSHAASLELVVALDGEQAGVYDASDLGCVDIGTTPMATCTGSKAVWIGGAGGMTLDSWNLYLDSDPVINGVVGVTNLSASTQQFTLIFTLPIAPAIPGGTLIGGSMQGGATDNNGDGVTLSTVTSSSFYTAMIDGSDVYTLYDDPQSFSTGGFLSLNVPNVAFGTPIPSLPGPAALTSIGIRIDFLLSAFDSATFSSNFVVQPAAIPVPAAVWLFGSAIGILGWARRRAAL